MPVPSAFGQANPAEQFVHSNERINEYFPLAQDAQVVAPNAALAYVPAAHEVQEETPASEILPASQSVHAERPKAEYFPAGQVVRPLPRHSDPAAQTVHEDAASAEKYPDAQSEQKETPKGEYLFTAHCAGAAETSRQLQPAGQVVQVTVLVVLEYVPSGQISHTVFPEVEYLPAMHETRTPLGHEYPSVHGLQIPRPVAPANVPARHDMHVETPAGEYVFAAHMTGVAPGLVQL